MEKWTSSTSSSFPGKTAQELNARTIVPSGAILTRGRRGFEVATHTVPSSCTARPRRVLANSPGASRVGGEAPGHVPGRVEARQPTSSGMPTAGWARLVHVDVPGRVHLDVGDLLEAGIGPEGPHGRPVRPEDADAEQRRAADGSRGPERPGRVHVAVRAAHRQQLLVAGREQVVHGPVAQEAAIGVEDGHAGVPGTPDADEERAVRPRRQAACRSAVGKRDRRAGEVLAAARRRERPGPTYRPGTPRGARPRGAPWPLKPQEPGSAQRPFRQSRPPGHRKARPAPSGPGGSVPGVASPPAILGIDPGLASTGYAVLAGSASRVRVRRGRDRPHLAPHAASRAPARHPRRHRGAVRRPRHRRRRRSSRGSSTR